MMRRLAAALASATLVLLGITVIATPAQADGGPVNWQPDYDQHKITVTVNLGFYTNCPTTNDDDQFRCPDSTTFAAKAIVDAILGAWNGHKYKCWPFEVKINYVAVDNIDKVPADYFPIRLDWNPVGAIPADTAINHVPQHPGSLSSGDDTVRPIADKNDPSRWAAVDVPGHYVHEFGHLLRLDDNYKEGTERGANGLPIAELVPGQPGDAMFSGNPETMTWVSEEMINEAVERSGKVDTSKVKCNMTLDSGPSDLDLYIAQIQGVKVHLYACDYQLPTNDPKRPTKPIHFKGTFSVTGNVEFLGGGSRTINVEFDATIPAMGSGGRLTFDIVGATTHNLSGLFNWGNDGLLHPKDAWEIDGQSMSVLFPQFRATPSDSASECPK